MGSEMCIRDRLAESPFSAFYPVVPVAVVHVAGDWHEQVREDSVLKLDLNPVIYRLVGVFLYFEGHLRSLQTHIFHIFQTFMVDSVVSHREKMSIDDS